jgi:hypothetical protein
MVDPMGEMLSADWEEGTTALANARNDQLVTVLSSWISKHHIDMCQPCMVIIARDTRFVLIV